jgi:hypothetical protein
VNLPLGRSNAMDLNSWTSSLSVPGISVGVCLGYNATSYGRAISFSSFRLSSLLITPFLFSSLSSFLFSSLLLTPFLFSSFLLAPFLFSSLSSFLLTPFLFSSLSSFLLTPFLFSSLSSFLFSSLSSFLFSSLLFSSLLLSSLLFSSFRLFRLFRLLLFTVVSSCTFVIVRLPVVPPDHATNSILLLSRTTSNPLVRK